jgi:hypothetical protein
LAKIELKTQIMKNKTNTGQNLWLFGGFNGFDKRYKMVMGLEGNLVCLGLMVFNGF